MRKPSAEQIRVWIEKISESDREAFDRFFRAFYPRLVHFSFGYTKDRAATSDIVQDSFVILWEKRDEIDPERSLKEYLYTMVRNKSLNYIRDHSSKTIDLHMLDDSQLPSTGKSFANPANENDQLIELLGVWIKELPNRQREAFELSRFEGLDHDEIAGVMDISSNTVNNHIVAALDYLRSRYDGYQKEANYE